MSDALCVLIVDDSEDDARLLLRRLRGCGYLPESMRVESAAAMRAALARHAWDLILSDYMIPGFSGLEALMIAKESGLDLPFILVSSKVGEETLVEAMRAGAMDFLMKDRLDRLGPVVKRELAEAAARRGLKQAQIEWRTAFDAVRDAIFVHDADFRIVRANLAYAALGGIPIAQIIGKPYWEVFPIGDGPLPGCRDVLAGGGMAEDRIDGPDGTVFVSRSFAVNDALGNHSLCVHVMQDVTENDRVQEALAQSERQFRALLENASDLVLVADANCTITYVSPSIGQLGGYASDEVIGKNFLGFLHPQDAAAYAEILRHPGVLHKTQLRFRHKGGTWTVLETVARNALEDPLIRGIVMNSRDVTERKRVEQALLLFRELIDRSNDTIEVLDPETLRFLDVNQKACEQLGYSRGELLTMSAFDIHPGLNPTAIADVEAQLRSKGSAIIESRHRRKDGSSFPVEINVNRIELGRTYQVAIVRDITERKRAEERANQLAFFDSLTNLPNRRMLLDRLKHGLSQAKRFGRTFAVMFLDLDRFKQVNDTLGHEAGDILLQEVATRLLTCVRAGDTVSRPGGDEFVIVLPEIASPEAAALVAEKIIAVVAQPLQLADQLLEITISIGIAVHAADAADDASELMRKADIAMYTAKQAGRNCCRLFKDGCA